MNVMNFSTHDMDFNTVLLISQDDEMAGLLKTLFEKRNCRFISETTGKNGLASAKLLCPSLIILDLNLPNKELLNLCQDLRGTTNGALLVYNSDHRMPDLSELHLVGVDEIITAPISPMALLIKSLSWLARQDWIVPRRQPMELYI